MTRELGQQDSFTDKPKALRSREECVIELVARCKEANIDIKSDKLVYDDSDTEREYHVVKIPCGKSSRPIFLSNEESYNSILSIDFESYIYVANYEAIYNVSGCSIEAAVRPIDVIGPMALKRRLFFGEENEDELAMNIRRDLSEGNEEISLGPASPEFGIMIRTPRPTRMTLKINNVKSSHHDHAYNILEKTSNALFYQIDMLRGIALNLVRRRKQPTLRSSDKNGPKEDEIVFPQYEYDNAPMSLYWYGRGATGMPLLQYLAYYQSIEYYFPIYSRSEAQRRARAIIKDPSFRAERDSDIGYLLTSLLRVGGGFGDERSQLKATINECVDSRSLKEFIESDVKISEHLSTKTKLTDKRINMSNPNIDIRNDIAERIYDIRCKIVHAKSGTHDKEFELLLPFSPEAELLFHDIALLRFIAQKIIISASSPLRI